MARGAILYHLASNLATKNQNDKLQAPCTLISFKIASFEFTYWLTVRLKAEEVKKNFPTGSDMANEPA